MARSPSRFGLVPCACAASLLLCAPVIAEIERSPFAVDRRTFDEKSLDALTARLAAAALKTRQQAAHELLAAKQGDAPLLHRRLHRQTRVSPAGYRLVLRSVGAIVPNSRGRFSPNAKKPRIDILEGLLKKTSGGRLARAVREARLSVALMRALAKTRHPEAAASLLRFAYRHGGAFRDECGRLLRSMGDAAVPALVRARILRDPLAFKMKRYADYQLDRINRARPELALKHADDQLKAELLRAYGEVRFTIAVNAVIAYVNALQPAVRRAARWATLRYVSGRPPKAIRRKLMLPGGRRTDRARSLYMTYRQLAHHRLARELARIRAKSSAAQTVLEKKYRAEEDPRELAEALFSYFDGVRFLAKQRAYQQGQRLARAGKLERAIAAFEAILADDPDYPQRHLMASVYQRRGLQLLRRRAYDRSALMLTEALQLLDDQSSQKPPPSVKLPVKGERRTPALRTLEAQRAVAEALRDEARGDDPRWRLRQAVAIAPDLPLARRELKRALTTSSSTTAVLAGLGGGVVLLGLGLTLWRRRRR